MEHYISTARRAVSGPGAPPSKEYIENLPKYVDTLSRQPWAVLEEGAAQLTNLALSSLGILTAKSKNPDLATNLDTYMSQLVAFLNTVDPIPLRSCPSLIVDACQNVTDALVRRKTPIQGINLLTLAISKYQVTSRQLTHIHANLLELCLAGSIPKAALSVLTDDIDGFSPELKGTQCKALALYFYYGGMIYAALKKFREAVYFFEAGVQLPASTLSHVMLESYKKLILVSLIHTGELPQLSKSVNQVVHRILKPHATAYNELASIFVIYNPVELDNVINRHQEVIARDGNFGLVKQVKAAQIKFNIQRLTKTFLTLSLTDVASRVQLSGGAQQAESYILAMIQDGQIYAKINQKDGMVLFLDNQEKYDSPRMMQKIEEQTTRCIDLNKRLEVMNNELATNPDYINKVLSALSEIETVSST